LPGLAGHFCRHNDHCQGRKQFLIFDALNVLFRAPALPTFKPFKNLFALLHRGVRKQTETK